MTPDERREKYDATVRRAEEARLSMISGHYELARAYDLSHARMIEETIRIWPTYGRNVFYGLLIVGVPLFLLVAA